MENNLPFYAISLLFAFEIWKTLSAKGILEAVRSTFVQ
jgi:hypothetical protein